MLKFSGVLSDEPKKYIRKMEKRSTLIAGAIAIVILAYPCIAFLASWLDPISAIIMYALIVASFALVVLFTPTKADVEKISPIEISIESEDGYIVSVSKMMTVDRSLSEVKAVIDHGEWYSFQFNGRGTPAQRFVCQKNLISRGSLEDFERLFDNKIIKMK